MIKFLKVIFLFCVISFIVCSCSSNSDCEAILPIEPIANFVIVDENGGNLVGEGLVYQFENMRLYKNTEDEPLFVYYPEEGEAVLSFYYANMVSGETYNLQLSNKETDLIVFDFFINEGDCFDSKSIENVKVNGVQIEFEERSFIIVK